ncbi:MAG TPA: quinolinate synthase NadA [Candidatus Dormibacteraeota bacterium]|nr:quinolinate synthase NadA [Candidatus Dormibacteraeota bacterium]
MDAPVEKSGSELVDEFARLQQPNVYSPAACDAMAATIARIHELKRERNAVILAHNYQRPEIFEVADFVGDSLELARQGQRMDADVIVLCGVHFMAESAKILSPEKTVLIPDLRAGCSLADSVDPDELVARRDELRTLYPDLQVVAYVNTTAAVKAVVDVCVTSANAVKIVQKLPSEHILFVPDEHLASYVQRETSKTVISWDGNCYVHHQITPENILAVKRTLPDVKVLVHPECRSDVIALADAVLSTSGMVRYAKESPAKEFLVVTECGLSDKLLLEVPEKTFYKACKLCQFMKMITLESTQRALERMQYPIELEESVRQGAERSLRRMLELSA